MNISDITGVVLLALPVWLGHFLLLRDRGEREPRIYLVEAFAFGLIGLILVPPARHLILGLFGLPPITGVRDLLTVNNWRTIGLVLVIAATLEELLKFLPLAIFIYRNRYFNEVTDGIIYFALAGSCFTLFENLGYAALGHALLTTVFRTVIGLFLHSATTGIVGYYLARAKVRRQSLWPVVVAFLAVTWLHVLYNLGGFLTGYYNNYAYFSLTVAVTLLLNGGLFWFYRRATAEDQALGLSARHAYNFCPRCGSANSSHQRFCQHCDYRF